MNKNGLARREGPKNSIQLNVQVQSELKVHPTTTAHMAQPLMKIQIHC